VGGRVKYPEFSESPSAGLRHRGNSTDPCFQQNLASYGIIRLLPGASPKRRRRHHYVISAIYYGNWKRNTKSPLVGGLHLRSWSIKVSLESYITLGSIPNSAGTIVLWFFLLWQRCLPQVLKSSVGSCYPETCVGSKLVLTLHCERKAKCSSSGANACWLRSCCWRIILY